MTGFNLVTTYLVNMCFIHLSTCACVSNFEQVASCIIAEGIPIHYVDTGLAICSPHEGIRAADQPDPLCNKVMMALD